MLINLVFRTPTNFNCDSGLQRHRGDYILRGASWYHAGSVQTWILLAPLQTYIPWHGSLDTVDWGLGFGKGIGDGEWDVVLCMAFCEMRAEDNNHLNVSTLPGLTTGSSSSR